MVENRPPPQPEPTMTSSRKVALPVLNSPGRTRTPKTGQPAPPQLQFTLRELLLGMAALAVVFALCAQGGIVGALLVWCLAVVATLCTLPLRMPVIRAAHVITWGVLMPLICLEFASFNFHHDQPAPPWVVSGADEVRLLFFAECLAYGLLLYQMLAITVWVLRGPRGPREAAFMNGTLAVGFVMAACTATLLTPLAAFGFYVGKFIALLGFTPLLTTWVFWTTSGAAGTWAEAGLVKPARWRWAGLGIVACLALPTLGAVMLFGALAWLAA